MESTTLIPRNSVLNRTITISKGYRRKKVLPEASAVNALSQDIQLPNNFQVDKDCSLSQEKEFPRQNGFGVVDQNALSTNYISSKISNCNNPENSSFTEETLVDGLNNILEWTNLVLPTSFISNIEKSFQKFNETFKEQSNFNELKMCIIDVAKLNENAWNEVFTQLEQEKAKKMQEVSLRFSVMHKTCEKVERFFKVCENFGIDVGEILSKSATSVFLLRQIQFNPIDEGSSYLSSKQNEEIVRLQNDRDSMASEVKSLEGNYSNLFHLYEKMRLNCQTLKEVEDALRNELDEQAVKYKSLYSMYTELLYEAKMKLSNAEEEIKQIEQEHEEKTLGIRLALKRAEIHNRSLEVALQSKINENEELNKICNELIAAREAVETEKVDVIKRTNNAEDL